MFLFVFRTRLKFNEALLSYFCVYLNRFTCLLPRWYSSCKIDPGNYVITMASDTMSSLSLIYYTKINKIQNFRDCSLWSIIVVSSAHFNFLNSSSLPPVIPLVLLFNVTIVKGSKQILKVRRGISIMFLLNNCNMDTDTVSTSLHQISSKCQILPSVAERRNQSTLSWR